MTNEDIKRLAERADTQPLVEAVIRKAVIQAYDSAAMVVDDWHNVSDAEFEEIYGRHDGLSSAIRALKERL